MKEKSATNVRASNQASLCANLVGLDSITAAVVDVVGYDLDRATIARWLARGIRGHRLEARRIGHRWATTRAAIEAFARASGALPEEQA